MNLLPAISGHFCLCQSAHLQEIRRQSRLQQKQTFLSPSLCVALLRKMRARVKIILPWDKSREERMQIKVFTSRFCVNLLLISDFCHLVLYRSRLSPERHLKIFTRPFYTPEGAIKGETVRMRIFRRKNALQSLFIFTFRLFAFFF